MQRPASMPLNTHHRSALQTAPTPVACSRFVTRHCIPLNKHTAQHVHDHRAAQDINQFVLEAGPAIANSESTVRRIVSTTNARLDVCARCCSAVLPRCCDAAHCCGVVVTQGCAGSLSARVEPGLRPQHQREQLVFKVSLFGMKCRVCLMFAPWRSFVHGHGSGDVDALLRDAPSMVQSASNAPQ